MGNRKWRGRAAEGVNGAPSPKSHFSCYVIANGGIIFDGVKWLDLFEQPIGFS